MMCEKGAYGSLINSRVLSCEVLRGKAATAEMAELIISAARSLCQAAPTQLRVGVGEDAFAQGHCLLPALRIWRGLASHSPGEIFVLESAT